MTYKMIICVPTIETEDESIMSNKLDEKPKTFPDTFRSHLGTTRKTCYQLINDHGILNVIKIFRPKHLLWVLLLFKIVVH